MPLGRLGSCNHVEMVQDGNPTNDPDPRGIDGRHGDAPPRQRHHVRHPLALALPHAASSTCRLTCILSLVSATVIIVPRSAGATSPTLAEPVILKLIIASGKSIKYRDSLAFDSRTSRTDPCAACPRLLTLHAAYSNRRLDLLRHNPPLVLPRRPDIATYR